MAGKIIPMSQVKQLLRLHQQGMSKKAISEVVGLSRTTVRAYISTADALNESIDELLSLEDPRLEAKLHAGNPAYKENDRYAHFKSQLEYFVKELKRVGVTRQLLWKEYIASNPDGYRYSQFSHHICQHLKAAKPTMVLDHKPGEKLYVDFAGTKLSYIDPGTGEEIKCQVFVACLPYSDFGFAMAVRNQRIEDFIHALICCLQALGGVPVVLVPDNLKSAIVKADKYEPGVNRALEDFANHYGMSVVPARAGKPRDKALVENHVKLLYSRVYARLRNQRFFNLEALNEAIREKVLDHNQTRMQQKPYCREEKFIADEKPLLRPLPLQAYEIKYYKQLKVASNNHIHMGKDKHFYSVPYQYTGQKAKVIYTRSLVKIFVKGKQVAVHVRSYSGGYSTQKEHLCSQHQHYLDRSPDYYIQRAEKTKSSAFFQLVKLIFEQDRYPEQLYRSCEGLFKLHRKVDPVSFEKACQIAIDHRNYSYQFINNLIANNMLDQEPAESKPLPRHENVRGKNTYQTKLNF